MDHIKELKALGLGSRLKRLSERLNRDVESIYKEINIDFKPRWFPLLTLLMKKKSLSVTEAATHLKVSHVSVNQISTAMSKKNYISSHIDPNDNRRRILSITRQGREVHLRLKPVLKLINNQALILIKKTEPDFLKSLSIIERSLDRDSFFDRVKKKL